MSEPDPKLLEVLVCPQTRTPLRYDRERNELVSALLPNLMTPIRTLEADKGTARKTLWKPGLVAWWLDTVGTIPVEVLRFTTFDGKFGRVLVRYQGKDTHEQILAYLQEKYGPLDRTPGQISVGPIRVYAWHGFDTEITLRYESRIERGVIFFESRILREKLSEGNSGTVF